MYIYVYICIVTCKTDLKSKHNFALKSSTTRETIFGVRLLNIPFKKKSIIT